MIIRQWCRTMILQSQGKYFFLRITDMVSRDKLEMEEIEDFFHAKNHGK
jgi:hypothetical protein